MNALRSAVLAVAAASVAASTAATPPAAAAAAAPAVCVAKTLMDELVARGKVTAAGHGFGVSIVRCADLDGNGERDALFAIASGGTAGNIHWGIMLGGTGGAPGRLALFRDGYKVGVAVRGGAPEVLQPIYRRNDANCCPSSFEIRRYRWTGDHFTLRSRHRTKTAPKRFFG